jgi:GTP cyclohydrolase I
MAANGKARIPDASLKAFDYEGVKNAVLALLVALGENPDRPGLKETPDRVARAYSEFFQYEEERLSRMFEDFSNSGFVMVRGIEVWSLCEHHLLPFRVEVSIAYIPVSNYRMNEVLGLSKFARIAELNAHRLQLQERLISGIADDIQSITRSKDVAVWGRGEHLCMISRGIKSHGSEMICRDYRGKFETDPLFRSELIASLKQG